MYFKGAAIGIRFLQINSNKSVLTLIMLETCVARKSGSSKKTLWKPGTGYCRLNDKLPVKRQFPIYCRLWRQMLIIGFSLTALILGQIAKEFLQAAKSEEI